MIYITMSQVQFNIPPTYNQAHYDALMAYLMDDRYFGTSAWRDLYKGIDILDEAKVVTENRKRTFRQIFDEYIGRPFAGIAPFNRGELTPHFYQL